MYYDNEPHVLQPIINGQRIIIGSHLLQCITGGH